MNIPIRPGLRIIQSSDTCATSTTGQHAIIAARFSGPGYLAASNSVCRLAAESSLADGH
jgi:hypothetical protein